MQKTLTILNLALFILMSAAYFYHVVYMAVGLFGRRRCAAALPTPYHRFAALVCARNESAVIGELIASLKKQEYPAGLLDIYVLADNCTDDTAERARASGAIVYRRSDSVHVGKGFALNYLLHRIDLERGYGAYDGYFVFDADNLVDPQFVAEMNRTFCRGYEVVTSYRNSKNFTRNWVTYGYSVWFLFEARFINAPRMALGNGCAISGTGFLVSSRVVEKNNGWPFHLLTEDIQFSVNCALSGCRIGYCDNAIVYDEQPETFAQSWRQRMRWSKGFYQIDARYLGRLARGAFGPRGSRMTCYDILLTVAPTWALSVAVGAADLIAPLFWLNRSMAAARLLFSQAVLMMGGGIVLGYLGVVLMGALTLASEWKRIHAPAGMKLALLPTFPLFLATYLPISLAALVARVDWKPIRHYAAPEFSASVLSGGR